MRALAQVDEHAFVIEPEVLGDREHLEGAWRQGKHVQLDHGASPSDGLNGNILIRR
jgi:hypothetical protein